MGEIYKIMLVDDELTTLTKLKTLMDYEKWGFSICGEAMSASSAIQQLEIQQPDILFTDMKMPGMDGVAFIRYLKEHYPHIKVIAISGYEDFHYVYEGLQNGALDYLLKHKLDQNQMLAVLNKVKSKLMIERETHQKELAYRSKLFVADKIMIKETFRRLLTGESGVSDTQTAELAESFKRFYLVLFEIDDFRENPKINQTLEDFIDKIFSEVGICNVIYMNQGKYAVLVTFGGVTSEQRHLEALYNAMHRCQNSAVRFLNTSLSGCKSGPLTGFAALQEDFEMLNSNFYSKFYIGPGKIIEMKPSRDYDKEFAFPPMEDHYETWVEALRKQTVDYFIYAEKNGCIRRF